MDCQSSGLANEKINVTEECKDLTLTETIRTEDISLNPPDKKKQKLNSMDTSLNSAFLTNIGKLQKTARFGLLLLFFHSVFPFTIYLQTLRKLSTQQRIVKENIWKRRKFLTRVSIG